MARHVLKIRIALLLLPVVALAGLGLTDAHPQAEEYFKQGLEAIRRGAFGEAEIKVKSGLKINPRSPVGYDLLGIAYDGLNRFRDAQEAFREALKLNPNFVPAHNDLGRALYRHGMVQAATEQFTQALRADPANFAAHYNLGVIFLEEKKYQLAARHLEAAVRRAPNDAPTLLGLTKARLGAGEKDRARGAARRLISSNPSDPAIRFTLGTIFLEWKQYQDAAAHLEFARLADPKNYEVLYDLGQAYTHLKRFSEAEDVFLHGLAVREDSVEALYQLAVVYAQSGHPDQAIQLLVRARQLAPERPDILLLLGRESIQEGFVEDAIEVLRDAVKLDPEKVEPHLLLGEALTRNKQFPKALEEYEKFAQLESSSAQALVLVGRTLWYMTRRPEAEENLRKALRFDPKNSDAAYYLGLFAANEGNYSLAERWLQQVLGSNPSHLGAVYEMGTTCMKEQDYARARVYLEKAKLLSPTFSQIHYRLATVYRRLGDVQRADEEIALFKKYDELDAQRRADYPQGLLEFLKETQNLPEKERLERYRQALTKAEEKKPDDINNLFMLAQVCLKLGQERDGLEQLQKISSLRPGEVQVVLRSASLLAASNHYRDAARELESLLAKHKDAPELRLALASLYYTMHRDREALKVLDTTNGNSQQSPASHDLRGRIWDREGNFTKALEEFEQAHQLGPLNEDYILDYASELALAGHMDAASNIIKKARTELPTSGKILFLQGVWDQLAGVEGQALKSFQQAADLSWRWEVPYVAQADLLRRSGSFSAALGILDQAASLFPSSPWPHWFKGLTLTEIGSERETQAASEFAQSLALAENQPNAYPALLVSSLGRTNYAQATEIRARMTARGFGEELDLSQLCNAKAQAASAPALRDKMSKEHSGLRLLVDLARGADFLLSGGMPQSGP